MSAHKAHDDCCGAGLMRYSSLEGCADILLAVLKTMSLHSLYALWLACNSWPLASSGLTSVSNSHACFANMHVMTSQSAAQHSTMALLSVSHTDGLQLCTVSANRKAAAHPVRDASAILFSCCTQALLLRGTTAEMKACPMTTQPGPTKRCVAQQQERQLCDSHKSRTQ